jgi:hypothetical protein
MVSRGVFAAVLGAALIAGGAASAADYRPDEFLTLDLSKAVLSPKPLGPMNSFAPVAVEAKGDAVSGVLAQHDANKVAVERVKGAPVRTELTSAAREAARCRARTSCAPARQSVERPGSGHAHPEMAVQSRHGRHLRLAALKRAVATS